MIKVTITSNYKEDGEQVLFVPDTEFYEDTARMQHNADGTLTDSHPDSEVIWTIKPERVI